MRPGYRAWYMHTNTASYLHCSSCRPVLMHPDLAASLVSTLFHLTPLNLPAINSSELCLQLCCPLALTSTSVLIPRPLNSLLIMIHCYACMPTKSILHCIHRLSLDGENWHWTARRALSTGRSTDQWDSIVTTAARCRRCATRFANMCDTLDMRSTLPGHNGTLLGREIGKFGFHGGRCGRWRKRKACSAILKQWSGANHRNAGSRRRRAAGILPTPRASRNNGHPKSRQPSTSPSSETAPPDDALLGHDARPGSLTMSRPGRLGMRRLSRLLVYCVRLRTRPLLQYVCTLCGFSLSF
jgi:hypothetical protein